MEGRESVWREGGKEVEEEEGEGREAGYLGQVI